MRLVVFAASNSRKSINKALVQHAAERFVADVAPNTDVTVLDLNDFEMPIYSTDREQEGGIPDQAQAFYDAIGSADALLISYAEHNGSYTAAFKNIFDWSSRVSMRVFQDKPTVILSTSPGAGGGASVMKTALGAAPHFGAQVVASLSVPRFNTAFDTDAGTLVDGELIQKLGEALRALGTQMHSK